jgi:hypothetical protein
MEEGQGERRTRTGLEAAFNSGSQQQDIPLLNALSQVLLHKSRNTPLDQSKAPGIPSMAPLSVGRDAKGLQG